MIRNMSLVVALVLLSALAISCVKKPRMAYSTDQLTKLSDLPELMRSLYHDLSPVWAAAKKDELVAADLQTMVKVAPRVAAISRALASKPVASRFKAGFADQASTMGSQSGAMGEAAAGADEAGARKALKGINASCSACHKAHK